ncbi:MAG: Asp-tRNA(Asn)/Glu-tRNA(Gln) amidotransferase subunit GatB [Planctomycetota bacterium]
MSGSYEVVIGLEVHAQLDTVTKLFCGCRVTFGEPPNTHTCPVCLGLPGTLPVINAEALRLCAVTAKGLGCRVPEVTRFDRKNYFYPDQPKNYQITQDRAPLGTCGRLTLLGSGKELRIHNVHLEEDAGKLLHAARPGAPSIVDLNRAGVPLAEIVSEPDLRSIEETIDAMETLRLTLLHLGVSRCRMEEGNLRFEASVSLRPRGQAELGTRVEIKNLNSKKAVAEALGFEIARQERVLEGGGVVAQETRLWDDVRTETRRMRGKEDAHDYRYFPEPDLPPVALSAEFRDELQLATGSLPHVRRARYIEELSLKPYDANVLIQDPTLCGWFDELAAQTGKPGAAADLLLNSVLAQVKQRGVEDVSALGLTAARLAELASLEAEGVISRQVARTKVLPAMIDRDLGAEAVVEALDLRQNSDSSALQAIVDEVLAKNPDPAGQYRAGKVAVLGFLVGQCMKASRGQGNPKVLKELLQATLGAPAGDA